MTDPQLPSAFDFLPAISSGPSPAQDHAGQLAELARQSAALNEKIQQLATKTDPAQIAGPDGAGAIGRMDIFHNYMGIFVVSFLVAIIITPFMRRLAIANGIVDRPSVARKLHRAPIAYLGGVGVYLAILAGILFAYTAPLHHMVTFHETKREIAHALPGGVPIVVLMGMTVIMFCGLVDDVMGIDPRAKIAGMLFAAAALASQDVGVKVAAGVVIPIAHVLNIPVTSLPDGMETIAFQIPLPISVLGYHALTFDVVYWIGTAVIAVFVLGACNASNLIDGLDGLLSGVTATANVGLLIISLGLAVVDDGPLDTPRIVLCLAVLGACLGFLPHNFNPATIFLGDAGSLLLGYCTIVIVLMLGDTGKTHLVLAGLIIYAIPIIDTTLAIVRRKMSGRSISDADDQHLHHMLRRALGVKGAVFVLYGIGAVFALLGILLSEGRQRDIYAPVLVFAAFIGVIALKVGRRDHIEREMHEAESRRSGVAGKLPSARPPRQPAPDDSKEETTHKNGKGGGGQGGEGGEANPAKPDPSEPKLQAQP